MLSFNVRWEPLERLRLLECVCECVREREEERERDRESESARAPVRFPYPLMKTTYHRKLSRGSHANPLPSAKSAVKDTHQSVE